MWAILTVYLLFKLESHVVMSTTCLTDTTLWHHCHCTISLGCWVISMCNCLTCSAGWKEWCMSESASVTYVHALKMQFHAKLARYNSKTVCGILFSGWWQRCVCLRTCDQILRINSVDVSRADKATILHLLRSATKPLRLVSQVTVVSITVYYLIIAQFWGWACG